MMKLTFLGTGASGGNPGVGRSKRLESSLFLQDETSILIDVTRNFSQQASDIKRFDSILLTHGHKDAIGGFYQLRKLWKKRSQELTKTLPAHSDLSPSGSKTGRQAIPIFVHAKTIVAIKRHYKRLDHCSFFAVNAGEQLTIGDWGVEALVVPHAKSKAFPTFAWKIRGSSKTIVYASDMASIRQAFTKFCQNIDILIIDGAMWKKQIFTHLTIDKELPAICTWKVGKIFITQIGKTAPPHEKLMKEVHALCPKAHPAYDGMRVDLR